MNSSRVSPADKPHMFKKKKYRFQYNYLKKFFLLIKQRKIVYPVTIFLLVLVLYGYGYCVSGKQKEFEEYHPVLQTMEYVSNFFLTASIVITILYLPKNGENFYEFFTTLYPEGNKLLVPLLAMKKNHFWRNFFICNLCIGSLIALNAWFFLANFGWIYYKFIIFRDLEFYVYNFVLLLCLALARKLELRFAELNEILQYKTESFLKSNAARRRNIQLTEQENLAFILSSEHFYSVRTFRIMHYDLCNLVKTYNDMFGRIILSSVVFNIANLLAKVTFVIDYCININNVEQRRLWGYFLGIIGFWIFANVGQTFLFSFYGDQLQKEGEKTTRICFYLLNKVSITPCNDDEKLVQDELKLMAYQSYTRIPALSAGGFFDINFRVLGLMISSITSYLMVIIQFLLRPNNSS